MVNKKGQAIGWVTSAAVDVDGVILGLAPVQSRYAKPGDEIGIFNVPQIHPQNSSKLTATFRAFCAIMIASMKPGCSCWHR